MRNIHEMIRHEMIRHEMIRHILERLSCGEAILELLLCECGCPPFCTGWCLCQMVPDPVAAGEGGGGGEGRAGGEQRQSHNSLREQQYECT